MKTIILIIFTSLFTWANGSFYDLYAQNRANNKPNLITADFIAYAYASYKLNREQEVEEKVLKPRVLNFVNYLYQGVTEMNITNKEQTLTYTAVLSLLAKDGMNLIVPDGYEHLAPRIQKEAQLVTSANAVAISPVMQVRIDYKTFKVPSKYKNNTAYFRVMKYAQTIQFNKTLAQNIKQTISASERLNNLNRHIKEIFSQFIGVEKKSNTLLSTYKGLDYYIFQKSTNPSINDIAKALNPQTSKSPFIQQRLLNLYSSYDYDFKIMQTLLKNGHANAFKGFYNQNQYRTQLYRTQFDKKVFKTKSIHQETRKEANIESKLEETLSIMIEGALVFANSIKNNEVDKNMIMTLKELRKMSQKKSMNIPFTARDINFLNSLDLIFLELTGVQNRAVKAKVVHFSNKQMKNFSFGGRFKSHVN
jgi:hypothetical protein